jgi:2-polyprenyl-3-methyl-5-hydroxy-6-metoxy-1,4-benzoquinol methylase
MSTTSNDPAGAAARDLPGGGGQSHAGNVYDKYTTSNPVARLLTERFRRHLDDLWRQAGPSTQLDVGCGEGVIVHSWALARPDARFTGLDVEDARLKREWESRLLPNLSFVCGDAQSLSFDADSFDLVSAIEVLEHLPEPEAALEQMAHISRRHLLVSVPNEPLWRVLNLARGAYLPSLGNTPGHINHWSPRRFIELISSVGDVVDVRTPLPWTIALVRVR